MKEIHAESLPENYIKLIARDWGALTVQDEGKVNAMTVSWVQVGYLWNQDVVTVYVRPQRHTYPLINKEDTFSLAFFDESHRANLAYLGKVSGRDEDKLAHCGYTTLEENGTPYIEQARLVLICRKLYVQDMEGSCFTDERSRGEYPNDDFHRIFTAKIEKVLIQE